MQPDEVLCYAFSENLNHVVLIEKTHPPRLAGKLNGVGGAIDSDDADEYAAIIREFTGEAGIQTSREEWHPVTVFKNAAGRLVGVYCAKGDKFMNADTTPQPNPQKTEKIHRLSLADALIKDNLLPDVIGHLQASIDILCPAA